jgi:ComF family protein
MPKIIDIVAKTLGALSFFLFPLRCPLCHALLYGKQSLCKQCTTQLIPLQLNQTDNFNHYGFVYFNALFIYKDVVRSLIINFKFNQYYHIKYYFSLLLVPYFRQALNAGYQLVAAPSSSRNQSFYALLKQLKRHNIILNSFLVKKNHSEQKKLNRAERFKSVQGNIALKKGAIINTNVLLFDDVLTTGATLTECAKILKEAGAVKVAALVIAIDLLTNDDK